MIKNILYVGNSIPNYLQNDNFNVILYNMDLTESANEILDKLIDFLNYKLFDIVVAENLYAFYTMQITGHLKLLINPYIPKNIEELNDTIKESYSDYLNNYYDSENSYGNFGLFVEGNETINNFKKLFYVEHCYVYSEITSEIINNIIESIKVTCKNDGELVFII